MRIIFETIFGSHLYGTSISSSDLDYKGVYIPSVGDILSSKIPDVKTFNTGSNSEKNQAGDVDRQYYSIHKFFEMLRNGDMNAIEVLFASTENALVMSNEWRMILHHREKMLTRQCKGFVGYVRRQANTYGARGDRLNELTDLINFLSALPLGPNDKLETLDIEGVLRNFVVDKEHTSFKFIENCGKQLFHLVCCDRAIPMTVTHKTALDTFQRVLDNYGARAHAAATNQGIDWKAVMHAVRISEEAIELLSTGNISFPRSNKNDLLDIRTGNVLYEDASKILEDNLATIEMLSEVSSLPKEVDWHFMENFYKDFYRKEILDVR